jgi:RNA polymerase sigma-70 factor, ECF subfamily
MNVSDTQLLELAVAGDAEALRSLLKRFGPQVRDTLRGRIDRRLRSLLDEDDVMQITYLEAFLHIDQLTARDPTSFVAWLNRIAQNALRDAIRGLTRQKRPHPARRVAMPAGGDSSFMLLELLGTEASTPSRHATRDEVAEVLETVLAALPPDYATVVRYCDLEGLTASDVAERMGRSAGAVHMLRARAHDRMRELLGSPSRFFSSGA